MSEILNNLNDDYKQKKKEATSREEKHQIKQDYREMKELIKGADELLKKHDEELKKMNSKWDKFDLPSFDEYKENNSNIENDETFKEMNEKIETSKKQFKEQKKHSDEVMRKADKTIKQIDDKLLELENDKKKDINNMNEKNFKLMIKEYIPNPQGEDVKFSLEVYSEHFLSDIKPHTIFCKNITINDEIKYNKMIEIIENNLDTIKKLNSENVNSFKGGLQQTINIQINDESYMIIGNTDNQEMKQLYNVIKSDITNVIGQDDNKYQNKEETTEANDNMQYLFEQDENGAFIRLVIPADFVRTILSSKKTDDMDLRGKKNLDLTADEVIVLKKYAYELSENNKSTKSYCKQNETDTIWWVENPDIIGEHLFTFDKEKIFNLFKDYPHALTQEQKEIFDKENPYWANYFKDRK